MPPDRQLPSVNEDLNRIVELFVGKLGYERALLGLGDSPDATYFAIAGVDGLGATDGVEFCRELPPRCGVVAVPAAAFAPKAAEYTIKVLAPARVSGAKPRPMTLVFPWFLTLGPNGFSRSASRIMSLRR